MNVLGIVTEYNPLHNGHIHHLKESLAASSADAAVCVMSGNFVQRGEPAIVDKWIRAEIALKSGMDLVMELPAVYALSSAEFFAFGAVKILDSLGFVSSICFGSETGVLEPLDAVAEILSNEPEEYKVLLKKNLEKGLSYPAARESALNEFLGADTAEVVSSSNNILGIEYLKALKRLNSPIRAFTIRRIGAGYNSEHLTGSFSSATSIRGAILSHGLEAAGVRSAIPSYAYDVLQREFAAGRGPVYPDYFDRIILSRIRSLSLEQIAAVPDVSEGLENRIKKAALDSNTLDELRKKVSTKRYASTRINRILLNLLLGISNEDLTGFSRYGGPQYIRVLGFTSRGKKLLSKASKTTSLPLIVKTSGFKNSCNRLLTRMLEIDFHATDQYVLAYNNSGFTSGGQDFTRKAVFLQTGGA
jgi:predicted nucleotidyltransferase